MPNRYLEQSPCKLAAVRSFHIGSVRPVVTVTRRGILWLGTACRCNAGRSSHNRPCQHPPKKLCTRKGHRVARIPVLVLSPTYTTPWPCRGPPHEAQVAQRYIYVYTSRSAFACWCTDLRSSSDWQLSCFTVHDAQRPHNRVVDSLCLRRVFYNSEDVCTSPSCGLPRSVHRWLSDMACYCSYPISIIRFEIQGARELTFIP